MKNLPTQCTMWLHSCLYKYTLLCVWMDSWTGAPFSLKNHKESGFLHFIHIIKSKAKPSCCCRPINLLGATFELQTPILWVSNYNPNPEDNKCMKNKPLEKNSISLQNSGAVSLLDLQGQLKHFLWYQNTRTRTTQAFPWVAHHIRTRMCQTWKLQPLMIAISGKWSEEHVFELSSSDLCLDWCFANLSFVAHSVSCISMSPHGSIRNKVCVCVTFLFLSHWIFRFIYFTVSFILWKFSLFSSGIFLIHKHSWKVGMNQSCQIEELDIDWDQLHEWLGRAKEYEICGWWSKLMMMAKLGLGSTNWRS